MPHPCTTSMHAQPRTVSAIHMILKDRDAQISGSPYGVLLFSYMPVTSAASDMQVLFTTLIIGYLQLMILGQPVTATRKRR